MALRHRKTKDVGLLFELLLRHATSGLIEEDKETPRRVGELLKKHFSSGPLAEERARFEAVRSSRGLSEAGARRVLSEVRQQAARSDIRALERARRSFYKEAVELLGESFLSHRLPDYRLYASLHMVLEGARGHEPSEVADRVRLEEALVRFMTTTAPAQQVVPAEKRVDGLVLETAVKKFKERYGDLSERQRSLLEFFLRNGDEKVVRERLAEEAHEIDRVFVQGKGDDLAASDPVLRERLVEVRKEWGEKRQRTLAEEVEQVLLYIRLADELESRDE